MLLRFALRKEVVLLKMSFRSSHLINGLAATLEPFACWISKSMSMCATALDLNSPLCTFIQEVEPSSPMASPSQEANTRLRPAKKALWILRTFFTVLWQPGFQECCLKWPMTLTISIMAAWAMPVLLAPPTQVSWRQVTSTYRLGSYLPGTDATTLCRLLFSNRLSVTSIVALNWPAGTLAVVGGRPYSRDRKDEDDGMWV